MVDDIYHPEYHAVQRNLNVEVDLEADKVVVSTTSENVTPGPVRIIFENDEFVWKEHSDSSQLRQKNPLIATR